MAARLAGGLAALPAWQRDRVRDPALASPVVQHVAPETDRSDGLPADVPLVDPRGFQLPESRPVAEEYLHLGGAAAGMDLVRWHSFQVEYLEREFPPPG